MLACIAVVVGDVRIALKLTGRVGLLVLLWPLVARPLWQRTHHRTARVLVAQRRRGHPPRADRNAARHRARPCHRGARLRAGRCGPGFGDGDVCHDLSGSRQGLGRPRVAPSPPRGSMVARRDLRLRLRRQAVAIGVGAGTVGLVVSAVHRTAGRRVAHPVRRGAGATAQLAVLAHPFGRHSGSR